MSQVKTDTPPVIVQLTADQLEAMLGRILAASNGQPGGETMAAIEALRASVAATQLLGEEVKRTVLRSNADHRHQSVFDFDIRCEDCKAGRIHAATGHYGHPKVELRHETLFCYGKQSAEALTPVEIELFNSFERSTEARDGTWTATIERASAKRQRLHVVVPCATIDDLASLPPLEQILMELLYGKEVVDPVISAKRIHDLEERLKQMEAQMAAAAAPRA
jgi:hypothetical protein